MSRFARVLLAGLLLVLVTAPATTETARAQAVEAEFDATDDPGAWFRNVDGPVGGSQSLAVVEAGSEVRFSGDSNTVHTATSLLNPTGAANMPFDTGVFKGGGGSVTLEDPGLYVFFCQIHPYMFAGVIADDPATEGLDLGEEITLANGVAVPTSSDLATRLLRTFFIATNPDNWQDYASPDPWHVTYPDVDVRITGGAVVNLPEVLDARYGNDVLLDQLADPATPAVGQVWVDTQFELTAGKEKPGTVTIINGRTWEPNRKIALPQIELNNPHNMWTDRQQRVVYITQWFDSKLAVVDARTGALRRNISVGESPAHVITRPDNDRVYVTLNGEEDERSVVELAPGARSTLGELDIGRGHPHGHWVSADGSTLVTPNALSEDASVLAFGGGAATVTHTGAHPIAVGMMPDGSKTYVANLLDSTLTVLDTASGTVIDTVNLLASYDPIGGEVTGPVGGLPIQTPVSPDGQYMVTANTLTATITVLDPESDEVVAMLPCDPGCHGVQFGAKRGGGYYAYVSSKFSNRLIVVDGDPNGDGDPSDATVAGTVGLTAGAATFADDVVVGNAGQGGQGILALPVVYNGWVQQLPERLTRQLTPEQRDPVP